MKDRTVLLIGAGASKDLEREFGLGLDLINDIVNRVTDRTSPATPNLSTILNNLGFEQSVRELFVQALDNYRDSVPDGSIDAFVNEISSFHEFATHREDFLKIARFSILFNILGYEGALKRKFSEEKLESSWIHRLALFINTHILLENEEASTKELKIITFNYDRNIEHLLFIHPLFENRKEQLKRYIASSVDHVYGKIGDLDWQNSQEFFEYGEDNDRATKMFRAKNLFDLMYAERNNTQSRAGQWIHHPSTQNVCAFGFNFDLFNCRLLSLQNLRIVNSNAYLVANVYPGQDGEFASRRLMTKKIREIKHDSQIKYLTCTDFLKEVLS